jgi:soluble lytic murein transglycosylase
MDSRFGIERGFAILAPRLAVHRGFLTGSALGVLIALGPAVQDAWASKHVPLPRPRPASAPAKTTHVSPSKPVIPLAVAPTAVTPTSDLQAVKQAIGLVRKDRTADATALASSVADPLARKLIEWIILRDDQAELPFSRYAAFIDANPSWPSLVSFRRKAEATLWQDRVDDATVRNFFTATRPLSAKGKLVLARALLAQGDRAQAQIYVRDAWRNDALGRDLEKQVLDNFGPLLSGGDHKARMDVRLYAEDTDAGLRAANLLGGTQLQIAKARIAVIEKAGNAGKLLDAVPQDARRDGGYVFSRIQWLRRADKVEEAAQWMTSAPRDAASAVNPDEWWIERRLVARKLLDAGDGRAAYRVARDAVQPVKGEYKVDQQFTAGWIALRALGDGATALSHFAAIASATEHPTGLARAAYWQGRAAETMGRRDEARAHYDRAARYPTAYYGQLARARLGLGEMALRRPPETNDGRRPTERLEMVRVFEILYAIGESDLVAPMASDLAERADPAALAALAGVAAREKDARATLLIGKGALARGYPFELYAYPVEGLPRYEAAGPVVEPQVAYSIARQESAFNPKAVSSAKAYGLMQVTAPAGKYVAKKLGFSFDQKRLISDPAYNVRVGAAELGDLIESYRGSYILSFAAYNAGRTSVRRWVEAYGDPRDPKVDAVDWVERIPFSETRNYVQRVMENLQVYRVRFGASSRLMIEADIRRGTAAN